eukprot:6179376-Pleurochrysis_carterae.AAC.3
MPVGDQLQELGVVSRRIMHAVKPEYVTERSRNSGHASAVNTQRLVVGHNWNCAQLAYKYDNYVLFTVTTGGRCRSTKARRSAVR